MIRCAALLQPQRCMFAAALSAHTTPIAAAHQRFLSTSRPLLAEARNKTLYDVLGVRTSSDKKEVKARFYDLSMQYHPDKNPGDEAAHAKFLEINEAYSVLGNDVKRREYDRELSDTSLHGASPYGPADGPGGGASRSGPHYAGARRRRANIRPDDWVQYRRPAGGMGMGTAGGPGGPGGARPIFDFEEHESSHYGPAEEKRRNRLERIRYYREVFETNKREPKIMSVILLVGIVLVFVESGVIQMIWMDDEAAHGDALVDRAASQRICVARDAGKPVVVLAHARVPQPSASTAAPAVGPPGPLP